MLLSPLPGIAASGSPAQLQAAARYILAEKIQRRLEAKPVGERTRADYERALDAFRAVYHGDPGAEQAGPSIFAAAELLASEGRCFQDARLSRDAVAQYEFLRREYPTNRLRQRALFEETTIEQRDLRDRRAAQKLYRSFLKLYPEDALAEEARAGLHGRLPVETAESAAKPVKDVAKSRPHVPAKGGDSLRAAKSQVHPAGFGTFISAIPAHSASVPSKTAAFTIPERQPEASDAGTMAARNPRAGFIGVETPVTATIEGVRYWATSGSTRLAIDMSGAVPYHAYPSQDGKQIAFVFFGARPAATLVLHSIAVEHDSYLRAVRVSALTDNQTEIVLELNRDLNRAASFSAFQLPNPDRLIIDLRPPQAGSAVEHTRQVAQGARKAAAHPAATDAPPNSAANLGNDAREDTVAPIAQGLETEPISSAAPTVGGQRSMARVLGLRIRRIVIDAGHGGHDSGTLGPYGLEEKDVVLDVALRLGRLLQDQLAAEVIYTRSTDTFVPLETRTAIANQAHADLFLSIHANSSPDHSARGVETYFLNFTASPDALAVAGRENAVSERSVHELSDLVRKITLSDKIGESREFAGDVEQSLYAGLARGNPGLKDRGVKQAPFVVLIGANMPSVLAEISFLTNPQDARELTRPAYRERLAEALYHGVAEYVNGMSGVRVAKASSPVAMAAASE